MANDLDLNLALKHWLYDFATQGIFLTDKDLIITGWNQWMEVNSLIPATYAIGKPLLTLCPDLILRGMERWYQKALEGQVVILSHLFHHYLIAMPPPMSNADFPFMQQTARIAPLMKEDRVIGTVSFIEDVTERTIREKVLRHQNETLIKTQANLGKLNEELETRVQERTNELIRSQTELHQAKKLEAIGRLAGGVAHDFNNVLTGILGMAEEIKESLPGSDRRADDLEEIIRAAKRAFGISKQLLAFGRRQIVTPEVLNINATVHQTLKILSRVLGEDIQIVSHLQASGFIRADPGQLEQLILNLAINARDAMASGGQLTIKTRTVAYGAANPSAPYVMLEVADTGCGMSKEIREHIFEPFFTTKSKDKGTGLGLATVYGIVKESKGDIEVESQEGVGTSFKIFFPITSETPVLPVAPVSASPLNGEGRTILVAEDEHIVRRILMKKLRSTGCTVLEAKSGEDALRLAAGGGSIDLLVTDVIMPGIDGRTLWETLRQSRPNLRALFISGYPEDVIATKGLLDPGIDFLDKTLLNSDLLLRVEKMLRPLPVS